MQGQPTDPEALAESATKFQGNAKDLGEVSAFLDEFAKAVVPATPRPAAAHAKAQKQQDEEDDDDKPKKKKAPHPDDKLGTAHHRQAGRQADRLTPLSSDRPSVAGGGALGMGKAATEPVPPLLCCWQPPCPTR